MCSNAGAHYLNHQHRVAPNAALRLFHREFGHQPGQAGVHTSRSFAECILPTHKVLHTESPSLHIGKFTADGRWLVCFSLQLESVVVLEYQGPAPQQHKQHAAAAPAGQSIDFHSFFKEHWRLPLCSDTEQLCRDFCLTLQHGRFLLLGSCTRQQGRAGAAAAGTPAAGGAAAAGRTQQQAGRQQQDAAGTTDRAGEAAPLAQGQSAPSSDCCDVTTFHVVDLHRCLKVDQRQYRHDHFDLSGNACASLHDNILALTSIRQQTIHLLHVNQNGTLTDVQQVGRQCQADDGVPIELAAAAEQQWQLQKQHERQQQQYWMQQQASALLPPMHCPPSAACQCTTSAPHNNARQQQQQQQQQQPRGPGLPAAPAQHHQQQQQQEAPGAGRTRRRGGAGGSGSSSSGEEDTGQGGGNAAAGSDTDSMDEDRRRRVRQRLNTQPTAVAAGAAGAAAGAGVGGGGADVLGQRNRPQQQHVPAPQQQQQQQQQQGARGPVGLPLPGGPRQQQQLAVGRVLAAAGDGGAAAAAAATSAALLDPGGQLITGLRQRLLAFLYKTAGSQRQCDVAPSQRDFQHNFGVLSGLVVWRARLLGRHQLLLKVGAPTGGPAAAADANPNRMHFFGVYDLQATKFVGFWKGSSSQLLSTVLEQPYRLLAASRDLSPVERCCAAALYPAGFPIGLEQQSTQQQQQQPSQAAAAAAGGGSSGVGGRQAAAVDTTAAGSSSARMLGPPLPSALASAAAAAGATLHRVSPPPPPPQSAAATAAAAAGVGVDAVPDHPRRQQVEAGAAAHMQQQHRGGSGSGRASDTGGGGSSSSSSAKAARERLKFLRQVVLMVLPGLQNLSPSPYLDPHLFRYSKHLSPIIGLRNSPAHPVRFQLARQYPGFNPRVEQQLVGAAAAATDTDFNPQDATAPAPAAAAAAAGQAVAAAAAAGVRGPQPQGPHAQSPQQQQQLQVGDVLHLDVLLPPTVLHGGEEVARRQLHLLHPSDPFVLVVVQTPGRPAEINLYFRM